jgi:hypothetical protein
VPSAGELALEALELLRRLVAAIEAQRHVVLPVAVPAPPLAPPDPARPPWMPERIDVVPQFPFPGPTVVAYGCQPVDLYTPGRCAFPYQDVPGTSWYGTTSTLAIVPGTVEAGSAVLLPLTITCSN